MTSSLPTTDPSLDAMTIEEARHIVSNHIIDVTEAHVLLAGGEYRELGEESTNFPVTHHFVPGMYCREIFMPAGSIVTSYIHRHEHPYVVSKGDCFVLNDRCEWERIVAPHFGVTKAGTRRLLRILEDTVWTTFHVTNTTDVAEVEAEIFIRPENPFLERIK